MRNNLYTKALAASLALVATAAQPLAADELEAILEAERTSQTKTAITIIFDTSGSMGDDGKMEQAKRAFATWLENLPEEYSLCLIDFTKSKARLAVPLEDGNREAVSMHVKKSFAAGKTPICDCLNIARKQISTRRTEHSPYERHVVVVFTDGYETIDRRGNEGVVEEIRRLRSATVEVVGIGFHGQGDYMAPASTNYFDANDEKELVAGLSQVDAEIGDDSDIQLAASDLELIAKTDIPLPAPPIAE